MQILFCYLAENNIFLGSVFHQINTRGHYVCTGALCPSRLHTKICFLLPKKCLSVLHKMEDLEVHFCLSEYEQLFYTPIPLFSFITFGTNESRVPLLRKTIGKCSTLTFLQELSKRDLQYFRSSSTITVLGKKYFFPLS